MFFWITLLVLGVYLLNEWTTIGPGLAFCLCAMIAEAISDLAKVVHDGLKDASRSIRNGRR